MPDWRFPETIEPAKPGASEPSEPAKRAKQTAYAASAGEPIALASEPESTCSVPEAAGMLGCSPEHLRTLIARGQLTAIRFGSSWILQAADVDGVVVRGRGRPPGVRDSKPRKSRKPAGQENSLPQSISADESADCQSANQ